MKRIKDNCRRLWNNFKHVNIQIKGVSEEEEEKKMSEKISEKVGLYPWFGKISWRRERLPTPGFWPGVGHN